MEEITPMEIDAPEFGPDCTYRKYCGMFRAVGGFKVKQKREIFKLARTGSNVTHDTLLPKCGLTLGQFSTFHVLNDNSRKHN